jgi:TRAP-type mannitol/chloroaromatic compound transport system permease small subunit
VSRLLNAVDRAVAALSLGLAMLLLPVLIGVSVYEIYTRKVLNAPSAALYYAQGEAFMLLVFLGIGYAYVRDAHVRVDVLRDRLSPAARARLELAGALLFMLPFSLLVMYYGFERAASSFEVGQRSALAFGRPWRWLVDAALPFGMGLFGLAVLCAALRNLGFLLTGRGAPAPRNATDTTDPA